MMNKKDNVYLAYNNRANVCTLAGGSWTAGLPLDNLKDRVLSRPARSVDTDLASTQFDVTLPRLRGLRVIALCRHNMGNAAKWRVRLWRDVARTVLVADSSWMPVWSTVKDSLYYEWEDDEFWAGTISNEDISGFFWNAAYLLPDTVSAQSISIEIYDEENAAGYVQIGRLFLGSGWQPAWNMSYGATLGYEPLTEVSKALDGTEYFDERPLYRVAKFSLDHLREEEALEGALELQRVCGISGEVFFIWSPADVRQSVRRSFLGRLRTLSPIEAAYYGHYRNPFEVQELL